VELPPWDNAGMDGYAVRASDVAGASESTPVTLPVSGTIAAGMIASRALDPGTAARIMTGAPIPEGADSVIRVEDTDGGIDRVLILSTRDAGRNVRPRGEDLRANSVVLEKGHEIPPWAVGPIAAAGVPRVEVHRRPGVAILSSGDELTSLDDLAPALEGRKIVSSNSYSLASLVRDAGGDVTDLGIVADNEDAMLAAMEAARGHDLLLTSGGVSVGAFDYTRQAFSRLGGRTVFWRVGMRPGSQLAFGTLGEMLWLGLPGNPASAVVAFEVFARPVLRVMAGHTAVFRQFEHGVVGEDVGTTGGATFLLRARRQRLDDGTQSVFLSGRQGSHVQSSIARSDCLLVVPEGTAHLAGGSECVVLPLGSGRYAATSPWS
jgi:molybdopterin molybdotransferase